jgi:hypothetical protein
MNTSLFERSPQRYVRSGGIMYLAIIILGLYGELAVRGRLLIPGDPAATAAAIAGSPLLWRSGIVGDLMMQALDIPVIVLFYLLFRPVGAGLNLAATLLNLVQTAALVANKMTLLLPLLLLSGAGYLSRAFPAEQLQALAYLSVRAHSYGFGIGLIFFGLACLLRGQLMVKSGYFPKLLGRLIQLAGLCYVVNSVALLLAPEVASMIFPAILLPAFVAELGLSLWMIIKGVNPEAWARRTLSA